MAWRNSQVLAVNPMANNMASQRGAYTVMVGPKRDKYLDALRLGLGCCKAPLVSIVNPRTFVLAELHTDIVVTPANEDSFHRVFAA